MRRTREREPGIQEELRRRGQEELRRRGREELTGCWDREPAVDLCRGEVLERCGCLAGSMPDQWA